jgi:hypothetical protein
MRYFQVIRILRALKHAQHNVLSLGKDLGTVENHTNQRTHDTENMKGQTCGKKVNRHYKMKNPKLYITIKVT